jgi:hypothetical protein
MIKLRHFPFTSDGTDMNPGRGLFEKDCAMENTTFPLCILVATTVAVMLVVSSPCHPVWTT